MATLKIADNDEIVGPVDRNHTRDSELSHNLYGTITEHIGVKYKVRPAANEEVTSPISGSVIST